MAYEYTIRYVKGVDIPHADALSRMKFNDGSNSTDQDDRTTAAVINCVEFEKSVLNSANFRPSWPMTSSFEESFDACALENGAPARKQKSNSR